MSKEMLVQKPWFGRVLPFGIYMLFILAYDLIQPLLPEGFISDNLTAIIYPIKILSVTAVLIYFWKSYDELRFAALKAVHFIGALVAGVIVFILWINMDWDFATFGEPEGYDPRNLSENLFYGFIGTRLIGTSIVVPFFEEIFWRSFLLRWLVNQDFTAVKIGTFTWSSFLISSLLFGSEHNLWLAGIMAGVIYTLLLYWSRSIYACIISHGVTNLLLGIYVLKTGSWQFW